MANLSDIIEKLAAHSPEEKTVLQALLGTAQQFVNKGHHGFLALSDQRTSLGLDGLSEPARTQFFGLVEALEIYQAMHGSLSSLLTLNQTAVEELRQIRDICLAGGTHAYY